MELARGFTRSGWTVGCVEPRYDKAMRLRCRASAGLQFELQRHLQIHPLRDFVFVVAAGAVVVGTKLQTAPRRAGLGLKRLRQPLVARPRCTSPRSVGTHQYCDCSGNPAPPGLGSPVPSIAGYRPWPPSGRKRCSKWRWVGRPCQRTGVLIPHAQNAQYARNRLTADSRPSRPSASSTYKAK